MPYRALSAALLAACLLPGVPCAQVLPEDLLTAVVRIENREREGLRRGRAVVGTGFLIRVTSGTERIFLVTNKHVTSRDGTHLGEAVSSLQLHLNKETVDGDFIKHPPLELRLDGTDRVRRHPERDVDVAVFEVTELLVGSELAYGLIDFAELAPSNRLLDLGIDVGARVLVLGYPLNLTTVESNLPVARGGAVASKIGDRILAELPPGSGRVFEMRAFLADVTVLPNSSGSPVFAEAPSGARVVAGVLQGYFTEAFDLGRVHDTDTVVETLALFFEGRERETLLRPLAPPVASRTAGELLEDASGLRFRYIPPGRFRRGSPKRESGRQGDEKRHLVRLSRGFWMAETEVTQDEWRRMMGTEPSRFRPCDDCPVEHVSWYEALAFANRLSETVGLKNCYELVDCRGTPGSAEGFECAEVHVEDEACGGYRLPTEAEWEYAARAGTTTPYSTGGDLPAAEACFETRTDAATDERRPLPVRTFEPNAWGLYGVHGNVWEWVWDAYGPYPDAAVDPHGAMVRGNGRRILRGGSWLTPAAHCRAANRGKLLPMSRDVDLGFRLALSANP